MFFQVVNEVDNKPVVYCLEHARNHLLLRKKQLRLCRMLFRHSEEELRDVISKVRSRISSGKIYTNRRSKTRT